MQDCWNQDPEKRPTFKEIYEQLNSIQRVNTAQNEEPQVPGSYSSYMLPNYAIVAKPQQ